MGGSTAWTIGNMTEADLRKATGTKNTLFFTRSWFRGETTGGKVFCARVDEHPMTVEEMKSALALKYGLADQCTDTTRDVCPRNAVECCDKCSRFRLRCGCAPGTRMRASSGKGQGFCIPCEEGKYRSDSNHHFRQCMTCTECKGSFGGQFGVLSVCTRERNTVCKSAGSCSRHSQCRKPVEYCDWKGTIPPHHPAPQRYITPRRLCAMLCRATPHHQAAPRHATRRATPRNIAIQPRQQEHARCGKVVARQAIPSTEIALTLISHAVTPLATLKANVKRGDFVLSRRRYVTRFVIVA